MNTPTDAQALADWLPQAWNRHGDHPAEVAAGLQARQSTLPADAHGAEAVRLAEHVWLTHLGDEDGLRAWLQGLPALLLQDEVSAASVQRSHWVLAQLAGVPAPAPADLQRWRGMHSLWLRWAARGRSADALAMLAAEAPRALAHPDAPARRALAASCNNVADGLREGHRGDAGIDTLMLDCARAARQLWPGSAGWLQTERADYQLARCHALLGQGQPALVHARACLAAIDAHAGEPEAGDMEYFYAHEALGYACRAAGDAAGAAAQRRLMQQRLDAISAITDADTRDWCQRDLDAFDRAAG